MSKSRFLWLREGDSTVRGYIPDGPRFVRQDRHWLLMWGSHGISGIGWRIKLV